ncbi:MAG: hypothetical protein EOO01_01955 [Chitinophagaceae bacterium]|nr:MAG: hypothetical protein EOO01_01955 [Chitinophagaceae bacterium]
MKAIIITKSSTAQKGLELNFGYNIATPVGSSFRSYISKTTFGSFQGSFLFGVTNRLKLGVQATYADYHEKRSTTIDHKVKTVPLVAKGEYSFSSKGVIRPYVGAGIGINFINYHRFVANVEKHVNTTKSAFTGDAGFLIAFSKTSDFGVRLGTSFNLLPYSEEGVKHLNSFNVQAGVSIPLSKL